MTTSTEEGKIELLPCPFCGCKVRIESNRDSHKLLGDHDEYCIWADDDWVIHAPATDYALGAMYETWNRRATPQPPLQTVEVQEPEGLARACNLAGLTYDVYLRIKAYLPVRHAHSEKAE